MEFKCPLIVVKDMQRSKDFYSSIIGLKIVNDFGANVTFDGGVTLQTEESWAGFIGKSLNEIVYGNAAELYFEDDDINGLADRLKSRTDVEYVHHLKEHSWGQRVIRFYDPDKHIIEVGEKLSAVVLRFDSLGLTREQIAERMDVPLSYVNKICDAAIK